MVKNNTLARFFSIHQVNLYDCSVKKVKIAVLRGLIRAYDNVTGVVLSHNAINPRNSHMRIEEDLKLGFKDVLIRPKRSTLKSRSDVELEREFTFKHSGQTWSGVPIIAANMDTVGTFSMAKRWPLWYSDRGTQALHR
jgi:hypothetical protein